MAGEIAYKLTADEAQALQAVSRLSREFGLNETAIKKSIEATKELDRTQQQMGREAAKVFADTRTPLEAHQKQLSKLDELHKQNKIDAETYGRAVKQATDGYESSLKNVHQQQQKCFGEEGAKSMLSFAMSFAPTLSAASALKGILEEIKALKAEAAAADRSAEMSEGSLAEVAGGDPEKFKALLAQSRGIAVSSGMKRERAAALTFAAASSGSLDEVDTFSNLHQQGIVSDPEQLMRATKTIQTAMGKDKTGSLRDITSKLLAAGKHSPQKIAQLGPATALAGVNAQDAGVSTDDLLAAVAIESKATGEASIASTMQKSLHKALARLRSSKAIGKSGYTQEAYDKEEADLDQEKLNLKNEITAEQRKMTASQRKASDPARWDAQHAALKKKTEALQHKKGTISQGIETDEEGNILDEKASKLRAAAGAALNKAEPGLMGQLHAIQGMKLDPAQLQKLFGRQEGLMAYNILLRNEKEFTEAKHEIQAASGKDLTGKVLALPAGDSRAAAAKDVRLQTAAAEEAAGAAGLGTESNAREAIQQHKQARMLAEGRTTGAAVDRWARGTIGWIPGSGKKELKSEIASGGLSDSPDLAVRAVAAMGGEESVFGSEGNRGSGVDAKAFETFQTLKAAAEALKASAQSRPTLAPPNRDPGKN